MRELFILIAHLLVTLAKLTRPGGLGAVAAESLAVKHQLLIMKRAQRRAPNLNPWDRLALGVCALLVSPKRLSKMAVILKPSTLLCFHHALVKRKYQLLYSPRTRRRPGPRPYATRRENHLRLKSPNEDIADGYNLGPNILEWMAVTSSNAAEDLHMSKPALTRNIQGSGT
ncbi:MAG: hypothetical protein ACLQAT_23655 [Candidatus Binataceae bacterium]